MVDPLDRAGYTLSSARICRLTGLTYRRLDYWIRTGAIPDELVRNRLAGSGCPRRWHPRAVPALAAAARVADAFAWQGGGGGLETVTHTELDDAVWIRSTGRGTHDVMMAANPVPMVLASIMFTEGVKGRTLALERFAAALGSVSQDVHP